MLLPRVVSFDPLSDGLARMLEAEEQHLIQWLVAHLAIDALDVVVLHGLARHANRPVALAPAKMALSISFSPNEHVETACG